MTTQRLIQNFRHYRGLLWAGSDFHREILERTLLRLGLSLACVEQVDRAGLDPDRDIVFLDADQPVNSALLLEPGSSLPAATVVGLVGVEAPSRLKLLAEAGATAILRKPVQAAAVYSVLFLGVNNYRRLRAAELRLAEQDRKRRGRRFVIKAVVALVQARGLNDEEAYAELRRQSMRHRAPIEEFCEALFHTGSSFPVAWPTDPAISHTQLEKGKDANAPNIDAGSCYDGAHDAAGGARRRSDQARRA